VAPEGYYVLPPIRVEDGRVSTIKTQWFSTSSLALPLGCPFYSLWANPVRSRGKDYKRDPSRVSGSWRRFHDRCPTSCDNATVL